MSNNQLQTARLGEPQDEEGECNARLFISDNYGDGTATIRCQLGPEHDGLHQEQFEREGGLITITWAADERKKCDHGCGQWRHSHNDERIACPRDADTHTFSDCPYCHPDTKGETCRGCGKVYYYQKGHERNCAARAFECAACGERGIGPHACPNFNTAPAPKDDFE